LSSTTSGSDALLQRALVGVYRPGDAAADQSARWAALTTHVLPRKEVLARTLSATPGCIAIAMRMRDDAAKLLTATTTSKRPPSDAAAPVPTPPVSAAGLRDLDSILREWLRVAFNPDATDVRRVTYEKSSGAVLEHIARGESVHAVRSLSELKKRLDFSGRHCYALFHHSLPTEPLAFIHVAFTAALARSMGDVRDHADFTNPSYAVFYSVNALQPSLGGLDLPKRLILQAAAEARKRYPTARHAVTLSPMPAFKTWLLNTLSKSPAGIEWPAAHREALRAASVNFPAPAPAPAATDASTAGTQHPASSAVPVPVPVPVPIPTADASLHQWLLATLSSPAWVADDGPLRAALEAPLVWAACHYLRHAKQTTRKPTSSSSSSTSTSTPPSMQLPHCPVARFHLRNGAAVHRVNWLANPSARGVDTSLGIMANYMYINGGEDEAALADRARAFEDSGGQVIHCSDEVEGVLGVEVQKAVDGRRPVPV